MSWLYTFLFFFIIYADALNFIPMINYWDEGMTIAIIIICTLKHTQKKIIIKRETVKNIAAILFIMGIGVIGNIINIGIQSHTEAIWKDIFAFLKFPLLMTMLMNERDAYYGKYHESLLRKVCVISRMTIMCAATLAFVGYFVNIGVYTEELRSIKCYQYLYSHPTYLVANIVFCIAMLLMESKNRNKWYIYLACVVLFLSQRFKAYAIIAIIILVMILKQKQLEKIFSFDRITKIKKRYLLPIALVIGAIVYFVFGKRFAIYLSWGMTSARLAMFVTCIKIAIDFFPIGSGFGTFASFLSGRYYSGIYAMYGLSNISGLRIDQYNYVSDTFWPWVIGQFGFVGGIVYISLLYIIIKKQLAGIKDYGRLLAFIIIWIYALLASTMEAFFTNATGVEMAVLLMIFVGKDSTYLAKHSYHD